MTRKRTSAGGPRLRSSAGGPRTRNLDCCCEPEEECTETTPELITQWMEDHAYFARLVVPTFTDNCVSGDCSALVGTYDLPFFSRALTGIGEWTIRFEDDFVMTICGVSRTVTMRVTVRIPTTLTADVRAIGVSPPTTVVSLLWNKDIVVVCETFLAGSHSLPANVALLGAQSCETNGGDPPATLTFET
jgi:hypothetical protein